MNIRAAKQWKEILRRAWSIKFIILAGILTGLEAVLSAVGADWIPVPQWARLFIIFAVMALAFIARLVAQKGLDE